jgi:hypothetical protein
MYTACEYHFCPRDGTSTLERLSVDTVFLLAGVAGQKFILGNPVSRLILTKKSTIVLSVSKITFLVTKPIPISYFRNLIIKSLPVMFFEN